MYAKEPCTASPLFAFDNVVATPHLGASTAEAQDKAGLAVARSVKLALQGEFVPDAVNVQAGGVVAEDVRPLLPLAEKLGQVFTAVAGGVAAAVTVEVRGEIVTNDVSVLKLAATKGLFASVVEEQVTYVNAPLLAASAGVEVALATSADPVDHANLVTVRGALPDGRVVSVSGTYQSSPREALKLTELDGFDLELDADGVLLFFRYADRPGVVGTVGSILGDAGCQHRGDAGGPARGRRRGADDADRRRPGGARPARPRGGRDRRQRVDLTAGRPGQRGAWRQAGGQDLGLHVGDVLADLLDELHLRQDHLAAHDVEARYHRSRRRRGSTRPRR